MRWTHFTLPVTDLEASVRFFTEECQLSVVRDRTGEGGTTVWLGPKPALGSDPEFVLVAFKGEVKEPLDHFGFQRDTHDAVTAIAERARQRGTLVEGPTNYGGSVGYSFSCVNPVVTWLNSLTDSL